MSEHRPAADLQGDPLAIEIERLVAVDPSPEFLARVRHEAVTDRGIQVASSRWRSLAAVAVLVLAATSAVVGWRLSGHPQPSLAQSEQTSPRSGWTPSGQTGTRTTPSETMHGGQVVERPAASAVPARESSSEIRNTAALEGRAGNDASQADRVFRGAVDERAAASAMRLRDPFDEVLISAADTAGLRALIAISRKTSVELQAMEGAPGVLVIVPLVIEPLVAPVDEGEAE